MEIQFRVLLLGTILLCLRIQNCSSAAISETKKEVEVITEPKPGEEYVLVQTANSQPNQNPSSKGFSTSHQIPSVKGKQEATHAAAEENKKFRTSHKVSRPAQPPVKQNKLLKVVSTDESETDKKRDARQTSKNHGGEEMAVSIEDEGQTGVIDEFEDADADERKILARKAEPVVKKLNEKKDSHSKSKPVHEETDDVDYDDIKEETGPIVVSEAEKGVKKPESTVTKDEKLQVKHNISNKKASEVESLNENVNRQVIEEKFEIVSLGKPNKSPKQISDDGTFDFVDTPLNDKILKPSGTSQASRVNIKKAANGQDYEYEYVYYYYDEDEDPAGKSSGKNAVNSQNGPTKATSPAPTTRVNPTTARGFNTETTEPTEVNVAARSRRPEFGIQDDDDNLQSANAATTKHRYTTIERTRGQPAEQISSSPTTPEPASNEVLPTRGSRFRGRQIPSSAEETIAPVSEERLPANTRFPPRSRSNHNPNPTTPTALTDTPITRVRGSSGNDVLRALSMRLRLAHPISAIDGAKTRKEYKLGVSHSVTSTSKNNGKRSYEQPFCNALIRLVKGFA